MRRGMVWAGQAVLAAAVAWFVVDALAGQVADLRNVPIRVDVAPLWIGLAGLTVLATYAALIGAWNGVLGGWGESLPFPVAARVWAVSNLGRYVPGKIWAVAGLAVLAQREGVSGTAAAASALAMQAISLGTGVVVVAALPQGARASVPAGALAVVGVAALGSIVALSATDLAGWIGRLAGRRVPVPRVPPRAAAVGAGATLIAWLAYGVAFWMLGRGVVGDAGPTLPLAIGAFAGGYIVGLIALFAPGGLGVREGILLGLLAPTVGVGVATVLAVSSRLLLTITELVAAAAALGLSRRRHRGDTA